MLSGQSKTEVGQPLPPSSAVETHNSCPAVETHNSWDIHICYSNCLTATSTLMRTWIPWFVHMCRSWLIKIVVLVVVGSIGLFVLLHCLKPCLLWQVILAGDDYIGGRWRFVGFQSCTILVGVVDLWKIVDKLFFGRILPSLCIFQVLYWRSLVSGVYGGGYGQ